MEYSNNYSKYIEDLKSEKSKAAFKDLVESTKEVKSNEIKVENVFSKKDGESISYEASPSIKSKLTATYEDSLLPNKKIDKINNEVTISNSSDYSSIEKEYEVNNSNKQNNNLSFEKEDSSKIGSDLDYKQEYSEKSGDSVSDNISDNKKVDSLISDINDYSEKVGKEANLTADYSDKETSDVSIKDDYSNKELSNIGKEINNSEKKINDITKETNYSNKLDDKKDYSAEYNTKSYGSITNEDVYEAKSSNDLNLEKNFGSKDYSDIDNDRVFLSKNSMDISVDRDYSSKSSSEIIASIKDEKKAKSTIPSKIDTIVNLVPERIDDNFKNYIIADPVKNEATDLVRQYIYFAYDPKDVEAELYAKYADRYNYYPRGSYDEINEVQRESIEDIFNTVKNPSNWDSFGEALVNSIRVASDVVSAVNLVGPAYNIYVDGVTINNLRKDLRISNDYINSGETEKGKTIFATNRAADYSSDVKLDFTNFHYDFNKSGYIVNTTPLKPDRWYDEVNSIGKIYVIPPYHELSGTSYDPKSNNDIAFTIPLQNNLEFEQISRAAAYNAISFFGRIGDIQQYSRTGSLEAINLTTEYFVDTKDDNNIDGNFSMAHLQDIEMQYRSLVLPGEHKSLYVDNEKDEDDIYIVHFTRPPVINIVMGKDIRNESSNTIDGGNSMIGNKGVYNNLFTDVITDYIYDSNTNKSSYSSTIRYKNFIVTNVSIDKSTKTYNYYVDEINNTYYDTMGFKVTLTVVEVDENYLNSTPSFNNYYNTLVQRSRIGS